MKKIGLLTIRGLEQLYKESLKINDYNRVEFLTQLSELIEWFNKLPENDYVFTSRNKTKKYEIVKLRAMAQSVLNGSESNNV